MTTELLLFKVLGNKNSTKEMAAEQEGPLHFCGLRMKDNRLRNIEFFCLGNGRKIFYVWLKVSNCFFLILFLFLVDDGHEFFVINIRREGQLSTRHNNNLHSFGFFCFVFLNICLFRFDQEKLKEYFSQFGSVTDVLVMKDPITQVRLTMV